MTQNNNLAYALRNFEPAEQQDKQPRIRQLEKSKAQARPQPKHLGRSLLCIGYIIVLCGALMFAKVQLTEENNAMLSAQSTLEELESESARLELQVEGLSSLKTVEKTATEEYGLVEPCLLYTSFIKFREPDTARDFFGEVSGIDPDGVFFP